ncbi:MAG: prolyl oligopeptidase family serine peptidase [Candidatus Aminicenantes bacterium]
MNVASRKLLIGAGVLLALNLLVFPQIRFNPSNPFSLNDIMSYAFPSSLVVSPEGDRAAWFFNQEGIRNIWTADGPHYSPVKITGFEEDDGRELGGLGFNHEGEILVFVRGGSANRAGEYPNPNSDPDGAEQAVWMIQVKNRRMERIGEGHSPMCSPVENRVVYELKGRIFIAGLYGEKDPAPLFEARGRNSPAAWSPDGNRLAFVSSRGDHSFIGIYHFQNKTIQWISPSVDRDSYPAWSPDGLKLAFIRFPGEVSFRGGSLFKIMTAEIENGQAETVWESPNPTGGFAQYYPEKTLRWASRDHLVFYSEHDKWMHLYSLDLSTGCLLDLTPGEFEVEHSSLSPDKKTIVFSSNSGDLDRRHLWKVNVSGGTPEILTPGEGIEWSPVMTSSGKDIVFLCSTAIQPAAPAVLAEGRKIKLIAPDLIPERFPEPSLVTPRKITFTAPDGWTIHGQLFMPREIKGKREHPAVIFMHGGPIRQMLLGWHMRGYYHNAYAMNQFLASRGFVVLSVNFRSGIGYGFDFRTAPNQGPRGASEYQDIVAAGKYLQNLPEVNPNKIGLWGGSYGGYLTALGLARDSELFAAGVDLHGVHDWSLRGRRRNGGGWDIHGDDLMSQAYQSSPAADAFFWTSPVLFIHGDDDRNVDFIQTVDMINRLRALGKAEVETLILPDEIHGFLLHDNWLRVFKAAADFFTRRLF